MRTYVWYGAYAQIHPEKRMWVPPSEFIQDVRLAHSTDQGVPTMTRVVAIDLFCGAGGFTYGLESVGIDVVAGIDVDEACRYPYETNTDAQFLKRDIGGVLDGETDSDAKDLTLDEAKSLFPDDAVTIVAGCAPCQPFSELNNGIVNTDHDKWGLLEAMRRVVEAIEPDIVAMENVPGIADDEIYTANFRNRFIENGDPDYRVTDYIVDCTDYLVPQSRERLVMLASRFGDPELVPSPRTEDDVVTVRRELCSLNLPEIDAGEAAPEFHPLHRAAGLRGDNPDRMRHTREGEDWHDLPDHLKPASEENSSYTAYGRMWWDRPAPTLTTNFFNWGSGRFGHPGYDEDPADSTDRAISLLEGALLQTFPFDYEFVPGGENPQMSTVGRLIGNAVPVRLAKAVGGSVRRHLVEHDVDVAFSERRHQSTKSDEGEIKLVLPPIDDLQFHLRDEPSEPDNAPAMG